MSQVMASRPVRPGTCYTCGGSGVEAVECEMGGCVMNATVVAVLEDEEISLCDGCFAAALRDGCT